jgi:hypothetical protein
VDSSGSGLGPVVGCVNDVSFGLHRDRAYIGELSDCKFQKKSDPSVEVMEVMLRHGADGFTSHPKKRVLRISIALKILRLDRVYGTYCTLYAFKCSSARSTIMRVHRAYEDLNPACARSYTYAAHTQIK